MRVLRTQVLWALILGVTVFAVPAKADIIYDNGTPNTSLPGFYSDFDNTQQEADDFLLTGNYYISDIHWWGAYDTYTGSLPTADDFTIRFFADSGGAPVINPFWQLAAGDVGRSATAWTTSAGETIYSYDIDITPVVVDPLTTFYISIVNNTPNAADWVWAESVAGAHWYRFADGTAWTQSTTRDTDFAFNLTGGVIPEPTSVSLLGLGLAGLVARGLRKRS